MTEQAFTRGPWEQIAPSEHHGWYVEDGLGRTICDLYYLNSKTGAVVRHDLDYGEDRANARLIAAAPDQHETLNYVADMTYCGADGEWHFKPGYDPQRVLDAIAKALGPSAQDTSERPDRTREDHQ